MSSTIKLKRSGNHGFTPNANTISLGELFLNYKDATLYFRDQNGRIYYLQATIMSYSFTDANVNGILLTASQGNTTLQFNSDASVVLSANTQNNSISISANLVDSYLDTSTNKAPTANALYQGLLVVYGTAQSAYAQANTAYGQANLAYAQANTANSIANNSLSNVNVQNAAYTLGTIDISENPIYHNSATAVTYTIPTFATTPLPLGLAIPIVCGFGAGTITISPAAGVSLFLANAATANGNQTLTSRIRGMLTHLEPNVWILEKS